MKLLTRPIRIAPTYIRDEEGVQWAAPMGVPHVMAEEIAMRRPDGALNSYWLQGFIAGAVWGLVMSGLIWLLAEVMG